MKHTSPSLSYEKVTKLMQALALQYRQEQLHPPAVPTNSPWHLSTSSNPKILVKELKRLYAIEHAIWHGHVPKRYDSPLMPRPDARKVAAARFANDPVVLDFIDRSNHVALISPIAKRLAARILAKCAIVPVTRDIFLVRNMFEQYRLFRLLRTTYGDVQYLSAMRTLIQKRQVKFSVEISTFIMKYARTEVSP